MNIFFFLNTTFGDAIGKVTIVQLLIMSMIEIPLYAINETICSHFIQFSDVGESMMCE